MESRDSSCSVLTLPEAAALLKVGKKTLYRLARRGGVPARKVGREWRFVTHVLAAWLTPSQNGHHPCWEEKDCPQEAREACPYYLSCRVPAAE